MTTRRKGPGGRREPPGGRPPKGNVKFYCYLQPEIVEKIDQARGDASRGEFITRLVLTPEVTPASAGDATVQTGEGLQDA